MIPHITGRSRKLMLPNGQEHAAVYAIVDLKDIKASHNEVTFNNTIGYPLNANGTNINDRNYKDDIAAQRNVEKIAENLNPEQLISLSSTPSGTPIINKDGIVVSGNNRVMSLKLAASKYPDNYEQYKQQLAQDLDIFGFNIQDINSIKVEKPFTEYIKEAENIINSGKLNIKYDKITSGISKGAYMAIIENTEIFQPLIDWQERMANGTEDGGKESALKKLPRHFAEYLKRVDTKKYIHQPVLVRIDQNLPAVLTTEDLAQFNQDTKKGERPVDRAVKLSNILVQNERCSSAIMSIVDGYENFSDLYSPQGSNDRKKLMENFVQCGLIPEAQLPIYYDGGNFTEAGKDYVETLLSAIILTPDAIKVSNAEGVKRLRQIIITTLPVLVTNASLGDDSLKSYFSEAIIAQYKINQVGDLSDYLRSQTLFDEEKISTKGLYINALLRTGRNNFKTAIKRYNDGIKSNSGNSLFATETLSASQIFDAVIIASIPASEAKMIQDATKTDNMQQSPVMQMITDITPEPQVLENLFINDNFFKLHPEKILGEAYETSGMRGKVIKYKGTIDAIERIDAPTDFFTADRADNNPLISSTPDNNVTAELLEPDNEKFVKEVIEKANQQAGEKILRQAKAKKETVVDEDALLQAEPQLQSFSDVWRTYNEGITKEELEVFIWYKSAIGKPLSMKWAALVNPNLDSNNLNAYKYNLSSEKITAYVEKGLLYYYMGQLVPAPLYLSGNIYDKKAQLQRDKDAIVEKYGLAVFNNQEGAFETAWRSIYDRRLTITGGEDSLVILPTSKLAKEFKINRIAELPEETGFKIKTVTAQSNKNFGRPDWEKDQQIYNDRERTDIKEMSLSDAFSFWLLKYRPLLKEAVSHSDIVKYYVEGQAIRMGGKDDSPQEAARIKAQKEKLRASTQKEGERLFASFLNNQLEANDKVRLETMWNSDYNNYLPINYNKIPVAFNMCRYYKGSFEKLLPEKREAVATIMSNGSGILAYDVGVGKTPSAIFTISAFIDAGYAKRPLIVVPNQVYKQFISEIKNFAPHLPVMEGYNLSTEYLENFKNADGTIAEVPLGAVTIITYEGLELIGFSQNTQDQLLNGLYEILNQGGEDEKPKTEKQTATFFEKLEKLVGRGLQGTMFNIEDFGFDFICYDEAHKMKKVFTSVKGEIEQEDGKTTRGKNPYVINSGVASNIALKGFMLNYYIQQNNNGQNVLMLTATPFTNSPLEIFSMLSMVGYEELKQTDLNNIKSFFDTYVKTSTELVINSRLRPQIKQVILGFNNLISLQTLIRRFINYKTGEDVKVPRPAKYVLPYLQKVEDGVVIDLNENERVETYLPMTPQQSNMMNEILAFVEGKSIAIAESVDEGDKLEDAIDGGGEDIVEDALSKDEKLGVRIIKGLTWSRNLALSPYLYPNSGLGKPNYKSYIETSPKLQYVMSCISSVRKYHISKNQPVSGQIIYMDRGIEFFGLIKEYLIKVVGFKEHEVGIIVSGLPANGPKSKEYVKNLFNGEIYNEKTKLFDPVSDDQRIKVVIGSSTIKEGINLQRYGTVLYDAFIDWNPSDFQQLCGRCWRQGNQWNSVRICIPLVTDSADIFLFQKLQEKSARLNSIWSTDGKNNVLKNEELNPAELKYKLIRDPYVIAELKSIEAVAELESNILNQKRQLETIENIMSLTADVNKRYDDIIKLAEEYRKINLTNDKLANVVAAVAAIQNVLKTQTDIEGRKMVASYERDKQKKGWESFEDYKKRLKDIEEGNYSDKDPLYRPYWFESIPVTVRDIQRSIKTFINQYQIDYSLDNINGLQAFKNNIEKQLENTDEEKKKLQSDEYKKQVVDAVLAERAEQKLTYKPVEQVAAEFSRLNYLLDDKKVNGANKSKYTTCPPMDKNGVAAIDNDALAYLNNCLSHEGQTKDKYFENGSYTPQRDQLHEEIIDNLFANVKCVTKGQPVAIFTGGSPASGKTTYLKKLAPWILTKDVFHLDADAIRAELPEYKGWNANATHLETQDIVNNILDTLGEGKCRYDFIYDGTMNKATKYFSLINKVKAMGYKTFIVFLDITYAIARQRALLRYQKSGRYVPMEVIDDFFKVLPNRNGMSMGQYALNELKTQVDGYIVIDGITGDIIEKGGEPLPQERVYENAQGKIRGEKIENKALPVVNAKKADDNIFELWKQYAAENPDRLSMPDYLGWGKRKGLSDATIDALYGFNAKYVDFNLASKYNATSEAELQQMMEKDRKQLADTKPERQAVAKMLGVDAKKTDIDDFKVKELTKILPSGGSLKGVTTIKLSEDGNTLKYGTKTSGTLVSVDRLSLEEIKKELEFETKILEKSKKDADNFNENDIWAMRGLTRKEKEDAIKMHKQTLLNNEQVEKIVIPFYRKHVELMSKNDKNDKNQEINEVIEGLQILADMGNTEAVDIIDSLKLLLQ